MTDRKVVFFLPRKCDSYYYCDLKAMRLWISSSQCECRKASETSGTAANSGNLKNSTGWTQERSAVLEGRQNVGVQTKKCF